MQGPNDFQPLVEYRTSEGLSTLFHRHSAEIA